MPATTYLDTICDSIQKTSQALHDCSQLFRQDPQALLPALDTLLNIPTTNKIILTGVGKSYLISKKIAATLTSTGTPAVALHSTDAQHGDMGLIRPSDCVWALSYSGRSEEVIRLVQTLKQQDVKVVGMGKAKESPLGQLCNSWIECPVGEELDREVQAPTVSSSAMLAVGDAIAMLLMNRRAFGACEFARSHPGGALGAKMLTN